jgi:hypothetical protein
MIPLTKPYKYHPACLAFPLLPDAELRDLADDIKLRGLLHPVVLYQGQVLDGRNRLAACDIAGVAPRFIEWSGSGSPVEWVISTNLHRRHLTASQRAVVALDLLPLLEKEAKQRQRLGPGKRVAHECATVNGKASEAAARLTRSGSRYVEAVKSIQATAPELIEKIRGGQLNIPNAKRVADLSFSTAEGVAAGKWAGNRQVRLGKPHQEGPRPAAHALTPPYQSLA